MKRYIAGAAARIAWLGLVLVVVQGPGHGRANEKNHPSVKRAFREVISRAAAGTVRILVDGQEVALGTIVTEDGYVVSKASLIEGEPVCRLADARQVTAAIVGQDDDHDLALLKIEAEGLQPVAWRDDNPLPGSLVAAVGTGADPLAIGVIGSDPRQVEGSNRPRAWLGISLGEGEGGLEITTVEKDSPAEKAGLEIGDRISRLDETRMQSYQQVVRYVGSRRPGDKLTLRIEREEEERELSATLGKPKRAWSPQDQWGGGPFSMRRGGFPIAIPHDAYVRPADCGGPLVDTSGKVVGINIARALRTTSYAIPADTARAVIRELQAAQD